MLNSWDENYDCIKEQIILKSGRWLLELMNASSKEVVQTLECRNYNTAVRLGISIMKGETEEHYIRISCPDHPEYVDFLTKRRLDLLEQSAFIRKLKARDRKEKAKEKKEKVKK